MLSLVCPVYNEDENIGALLEEIRCKVTVPFELLVVYDIDEDTTIPVITDIAPLYQFPIKLVKNKFGNGALNAIKTGFCEAGHEAVVVIMADLSDDLSIVDEMYRLVMEEEYDVVCGSRYMKGGKHIGGPPLKKLLSRIAGISLHYLTGIPTHDVTNSFKMYKKEFLKSVEIESDGGFEIGMELTVKAYVGGRRITELPSIWTNRVAGESRFQMLKWIPKYLKWYLYAARRGRKDIQV